MINKGRLAWIMFVFGASTFFILHGIVKYMGLLSIILIGSWVLNIILLGVRWELWNPVVDASPNSKTAKVGEEQ